MELNIKPKQAGYIIANVVIILSILSFSLSLAYLSCSYYFKKANKKIKRIADWEDYYKILDKVIEEITSETEMDEKIVSPYSGWFSQLPEEKEGFKITYLAEDSKIDINHISRKALEKLKIFKKTGKKKMPELLYIEKDYEFIKKEYQDIFSIYMVPNLNTADTARLKKYMSASNLKESIIKGILEKVNFYRSGKNYLTYNRLIIKENQYDNLKNLFDRDQQDLLYVLLDYSGRINLNFVDEKTFEVAVKLIYNKEQVKTLWNKIKNARDSGKTIEKLETIFGTGAKKYEKMFSVDTKLIRIEIEKEDKKLTVILRKYYSGILDKVSYKVLRNFVSDVKKEEEKKDEEKGKDATDDAVDKPDQDRPPPRP